MPVCFGAGLIETTEDRMAADDRFDQTFEAKKPISSVSRSGRAGPFSTKKIGGAPAAGG